jgi:pimeloyl-ACP methyl ester carboxylesterase
VWGDGLLASLSRASVGAFFVWSGSRQPSLRVEVLANGRLLASRAIRRRLPHVEQRGLVVARAGFYGRYYAPPARHPRGVPVLVFGGSEGGLSFQLLASVLALRGHPTLALAYFNAPGLPPTLSRIPLEYFARAIRWLRDRPEAGGRRVVLIGVSRGSEAAQLLGVHYPGLVGAVVAAVPSNSAICDLPSCSGPAWTFHGRAVPYTAQFNFTQPDDNPAAVIPVERIRAPLLVVCGGRDTVWRSCAYMHAIVARRRRFGRSSRDLVFSYPDAGHFVGSLLPYVVVAPRWLNFKPADERAREQLWPHVLLFLPRG